MRLMVGRYDFDVVFQAMAINNFWQSSKHADEDEAHRRAAAVPEAGSIWAEVLRRALPAPTRRMRSKRSCDEAMARDDGHFPQEVACPHELSAVTHAKRPCKSGAASCNTRSIGTVCVPCMMYYLPTYAIRHVYIITHLLPRTGESVWGDPFHWRTILHPDL